MFDDLVKSIEQQLANKTLVVVGISGFGGAGKTTLANKLRDYFEISDGQVVRLDNIFAEDHQNKPIFEDYDWPVITSLLKSLTSSSRLAYNGRGFKGERMDFDDPMPRVVIIEGVRLFRPEVMPYFDIAVWIDIDPEEATRRGETRDREAGADEGHIERWRNEWLPKDQEYFDRYRPQEQATHLYTN